MRIVTFVRNVHAQLSWVVEGSKYYKDCDNKLTVHWELFDVGIFAWNSLRYSDLDYTVTTFLQSVHFLNSSTNLVIGLKFSLNVVL